MASPFMRYAHGIPRGVRMPFSNGSTAAAAFLQPTFLLQLKKVGKKSRARAMRFIRLFCKLSKAQLDPLEARLRPVEQPDAAGRQFCYAVTERLSSRMCCLITFKELHQVA